MNYRQYVESTARQFVALMDEGRPPWRPGYDRQAGGLPSIPGNAITGRSYRGVNACRLWLAAKTQGYTDQRWLTWNQARKAGAVVRRGEKAVSVVFWTDEKRVRVKHPETGKPEWRKIKLDRPRIQYFSLFNVAQVDGLDRDRLAKFQALNWTDRPEKLLQLTNAKLVRSGTTPFYHKSRDVIGMPLRNSFRSEEDFLGSLTHEMAHWTSHPKRLAREVGDTESISYAREELVAEIASMAMCLEMGTGKDRENSLSYLSSWNKHLRSHFVEQPQEVLKVFVQAWEARDYVMEGKELERLRTVDPPSRVQGKTQGRTAVELPYSEKRQALRDADEAKVDLEWNRTAGTWELLGLSPERNPGRLTRLLPEDSLMESLAERGERVYLQIPFEEKDEAKAAAGKLGMPLLWDPDFKAWHTYAADFQEAFVKYVPQEPSERAWNAEAQRSLAQALQDAGAAEIPATLTLDGRFHRLREQDDAPGERSVTYVGFEEGVPSALIFNHRRGERVKWQGSARELSSRQWRRMRTVNRNREERRSAERRDRQRQAAKRARTILAAEGVRPAGADHPYLRAKGIRPHDGMKVDAQGNLLIGICDARGRCRSLQTISAEGKKRFLRDSEITGHFVPFGPLPSSRAIVIAEGVATAATLREALDVPVVAALHAGNLEPVAQVLAERYPQASLVIAADNDHESSQGNVGLRKAQETAERWGAVVASPPFGPEDRGRSDFNDLAQARGKDEVVRILRPALARTREEATPARGKETEGR